MNANRFYFASSDKADRMFNRWDFLLAIIIFSTLFFLGWVGSQMATPYQLGDQLPIALNPEYLPFYASRTVLRMFIALLLSIVFTLMIGALAAKNRRAERIIVPAIDVLQSIPVLSFLSITVTGFIHLFPGSLLGPECASIFAIFTSQVWNMTFGFYQSLKSLPHDLKEVSSMLRLSAWQRFWKVEVPFSMSSLLWNMMVSMSASWFFVVLSEAISVANQDIRLPGVGSYIAMAIQQKNIYAVFYAIVTMIVVIVIYDQLLFRPLIAWSEKFKLEQSADDAEYQSWLVDLLRVSRMTQRIASVFRAFADAFVNARWFRMRAPKPRKEVDSKRQKQLDWIWNGLVWLVLLSASWVLMRFILAELKLSDVVHVVLLGAVTATRVMVMIVLSSLVWVPVGVWIGMRPRMAQHIQPIIQFAAAFPANLFYPLFVIVIVEFQLSVEIWVTPLVILGTQWYILFNVIAGAANIPRELTLAADNFGLKGWNWWKRLALPGVFPYYITGAMAAAGGAWNASIVAEWVSWGPTTLRATGLGEYIQASTISGDFAKIALGTTMMCLYVLAFNRLLWRPLYKLAFERFNIQ